MNYTIIITKRAEKFLKVCDKHIFKSFWEDANTIAQNPKQINGKVDVTLVK
jgi:mRNA-degrading endonuclease RelE of RelBE toxin-antitoxin system